MRRVCGNRRMGDYFTQIGLVAVQRDMLGAERAAEGSVVCAEEEGEEADFGGRRGGDEGGQDVKDLF